MTIIFYNTLTHQKEAFVPLDAHNIRMYVCGPTVYGRAHLGNARSVVVYDVLFRLLRRVYGPECVTYARNITDVDDKINAAAAERGITIGQLAAEVTQWFHADMAALNVLPASASKLSGLMLEPKATDHIAQMIAMIERLISNGRAYAAEGHVLFSVASGENGSGYHYGQLSGRIQDDLEAGARVKVEAYKRAPGDFVLWKPAGAKDEPSSVFDSPWGKGRPGWHIECSAMSLEYLFDGRFPEGDPLRYAFDIHGGGADLMFPHHENEIAQSCGAYPGSQFARVWVHNGFLTVNGEKMSKSLGNFITVKDLLDKGVRGETIRYALLSTGYNKPLDWTDKLVADAQKSLNYLYRALDGYEEGKAQESGPARQAFISALSNDLNLPQALSALTEEAGKILTESEPDKKRARQGDLRFFGTLLGLLEQPAALWFKGGMTDAADPQALIAARIAAKKAKNWAEADRIRAELKAQGIVLEDKPDGTTDWRRK